MVVKRVMLRWSFFKTLLEKIQADDVSGLAAQLSYFFLLSLFPLLIVLFTLVAYLPYSEEEILRTVHTFAPEKSMDLIEENLNKMMKGNGKLLSFGIFVTLWSASNGLNAIIRAFNRAYDVTENRSFFIARGMSIILTLAMVFVFLVALLLPLFGKQIIFFLSVELGFSEEFIRVWNTLRWLISSVVLFFVFFMLYWIAPNKKLKCLSVLPGAIFATVGWVFMSLAFSFYVEKFGHYSTTYGSLGGIIILMIWFYLSGIIIIIGGEINASVSEKKKPDCA
ncbi:YihY/virulence factor BrkB family protein [Peribacillus asahii]|uniref:YihY/virulence factor BrkB family protein n=1 Tax=Peribacillus asahii TaxID=228899 RepID=UPI00381F9092